MNLQEIAQIYTDLVTAEEQIPEEEHHAKEAVNALRTKYHEILMERFRAEKVDFSDRFEATHKAFELIRQSGN
jgi:hypothetical protein